MKSFSLVALSFAALLSAVTAALDERSHASQLVVDAANCYWSGTAPFCAGNCAGNKECQTGPCGDGACCITGYKKYCCYGDTCP
ncbi:hypothetical protein DFH29DRAFT_897212 [Suillus ampliporus]|nr:hypothetical protein DFH29DRAFT_897212 [Suillus ampliporus]